MILAGLATGENQKQNDFVIHYAYRYGSKKTMKVPASARGWHFNVAISEINPLGLYTLPFKYDYRHMTDIAD